MTQRGMEFGNTTLAHFEVKKLQDGRLVGNELECAMVRRMTTPSTPSTPTPSVERPGPSGPLGAAGRNVRSRALEEGQHGDFMGKSPKHGGSWRFEVGNIFHKWWILMGQFYK